MISLHTPHIEMVRIVTDSDEEAHARETTEVAPAFTDSDESDDERRTRRRKKRQRKSKEGEKRERRDKRPRTKGKPSAEEKRRKRRKKDEAATVVKPNRAVKAYLRIAVMRAVEAVRRRSEPSFDATSYVFDAIRAVTIEDPNRLFDLLTALEMGRARPHELAEDESQCALDKYTCTDFVCAECGQRKTFYYEKQTRSSDEPMTLYIRCICGHKWTR